MPLRKGSISGSVQGRLLTLGQFDLSRKKLDFPIQRMRSTCARGITHRLIRLGPAVVSKTAVPVRMS